MTESLTLIAGTSSLFFLVHLVEAMHAGGRFLGNAAPFLHHLVPAKRIFALHFEQQFLITCSSLLADSAVDPIATFFQLVAFVDEKRHVAAVVDDQLRAFAVREARAPGRCTTSILRGLAFPGENRNAGFGDRGGGMILRGENIATCPAHVRAEIDQRLDQNGGLNRHVQRTGDAHAGEWLARRIFLADRHQARHFLFGDTKFLSGPNRPRLMSCDFDNPVLRSVAVLSVAHEF